MRQQPSIPENPKAHEQLAAQRAEEEHDGRNLKTCVGRWKLRAEAGCSRGRRCGASWDGISRGKGEVLPVLGVLSMFALGVSVPHSARGARTNRGSARPGS